MTVSVACIRAGYTGRHGGLPTRVVWEAYIQGGIPTRWYGRHIPSPTVKRVGKEGGQGPSPTVKRVKEEGRPRRRPTVKREKERERGLEEDQQ